MNSTASLQLWGPMFKPSPKFGKIFACSDVSTTPVNKSEGFWGHIGLHALPSLPCLFGSRVSREKHECQIYQYTWSIGCCATDAMHLSHCTGTY